MKLSKDYAAGFFDGEGCVALEKQNPHGKSTRYYIACRLNNTNLQVLEDLKETWGGSISHLQRTSGKPMFRWAVVTANCKKFLEDIYPFSVVKKKEIWLALEYLELIQQTIPPGGKTKRTPERNAVMEGYYLALREAKRACEIT